MRALRKHRPCLVLLASFGLLIASPMPAAGEESPRIAWYVAFDPLGVLTSGPSLAGGMCLDSRLEFGLKVQFVGLGFVWRSITKIDYDYAYDAMWVAAWSVAPGLTFAYLAPVGRSGNRFVLGMEVLLAFASSGETNDDERKQWTSYFGQISAVAHVGYRWKLGQRFSVTLGVGGGVSYELWEVWWYSDRPDDIIGSPSRDLYAAGSLDAVLRWQL